MSNQEDKRTTEEIETLSVAGQTINAPGAQIGAIGETIHIEGGVHFGDQITVVQPDPADAQDRRNLAILRDKVKAFWVEGVLEKSLYNEVLIELGTVVNLEEVTHPWERIVELPGQVIQSLPPGQPISTTFETMGRTLLILGEPGSGKTITLLELTRELIAQAEIADDNSQLVPVVFNLSSWQTTQPLFDWLVTELSTKYQIPKTIGYMFLMKHRLIPLLDGLDEVRSDDRAACVEAINAFSETHGLSGLVICSRLAEYTALPNHLRLNGAIRLKPLNPEQVEQYLIRIGMDTLRNTLQEDRFLRELTQSPLMLNIMILVYQDGEEHLERNLETVEARRNHLFQAYIRKMFIRKGKRKTFFTDKQTINWLTNLALGMKQHGQSIFLIETLQPSWLTGTTWQWIYLVGSRLILGIILGLLFSVIFQPSWLALGLIAGLCIGILDALSLASARNLPDTPSRSVRWRSVLRILKIMVIVGLIGGISSWLINSIYFVDVFWGIVNYGLFEELSTQGRWLFEDLLLSLRFWIEDGIVLGAIFGLIFGLRARWQKITDDIHLPETFIWSWRQARLGGLVGIVIWPAIQITYDFLNWIFDDISFALIPLTTGQSIQDIQYSLADRIVEGWYIVIGGPTLWLSYGLRGLIIVGLFFGLTAKIVEKMVRVNYKVTILASLLFAIIGAFIPWIGQDQVVYYVGGRFYNWKMALDGAMLAGMFAFVWYGGFDIIQHYTLRFILRHTSQLPWNLPQFLDHATDLIFLRKVGGGYIFIHRLLLEHFAKMASEPEATE